jgi:UDP-2,3-diacylglucosamine pyrophosphatase LpxH
METSMRTPDIAVISDLHLGTRSCQAESALAYLDSIRPRTLVLAGDIIDLWYFHRGYWPATHQQLLKRIMRFADDGVEVVYVTGNHDGELRARTGTCIGNLRLVDRLELTLDGVRTLVVHGDLMDPANDKPRTLTERCADFCYEEILLGANAAMVRAAAWLGRRPASPASWVKNALPSVRRFIDRYEQSLATFSASEGFDAVICGHIHQPALRRMQIESRTVTYLNSGDWVEHASALEYAQGAWSLLSHGRVMRRQIMVRAPESLVEVA